jgi:hypothetical protein
MPRPDIFILESTIQILNVGWDISCSAKSACVTAGYTTLMPAIFFVGPGDQPEIFELASELTLELAVGEA